MEVQQEIGIEIEPKQEWKKKNQMILFDLKNRDKYIIEKYEAIFTQRKLHSYKSIGLIMYCITSRFLPLIIDILYNV
jgi:hypothetical protein